MKKSTKKKKKPTALKYIKIKPPKSVTVIPAKPLADINFLLKALGDDEKLTLFFMTWVKHKRNATKAYQELHPGVSIEVAGVLGARRLGKVRETGGLTLILDAYGLGADTYFEQLHQGLNATKIIDAVMVDDYGQVQETDAEVPDHKVRRLYHQVLGKLHRIEKEENTNIVQVNQNTNSIDNIQDDELDGILER